jgi:hypothetical protein
LLRAVALGLACDNAADTAGTGGELAAEFFFK